MCAFTYFKFTTLINYLWLKHFYTQNFAYVHIEDGIRQNLPYSLGSICKFYANIKATLLSSAPFLWFSQIYVELNIGPRACTLIITWWWKKERGGKWIKLSLKFITSPFCTPCRGDYDVHDHGKSNTAIGRGWVSQFIN